VATLPELARVPGDLVTLTLRSVAFPFAVLAELRRLNRTLTEVALLRTDVGPHLEHLPNLEALQSIKTSLDRLSQPGGALDRLADISETLERLAELDASLPLLVEATSALPELPERVQSVEGLVGEAVGNLDRLQPSLDRLGQQIAELQETIGGLGGALEPIGRLAGRVPGSNRRPR
jgi:hypothetical protein